MKKILYIVVAICFILAFLKACDTGLAKEQRRKCIATIEYCEKNQDMCTKNDFQICQGVEDVD